GPSNYSLPASALTPLVSLAAPTQLQAVKVTFDQIDLTWKDNADDESGYVVERSFDGSAWLTIAMLPADSTSYQDVGLPANTKFYYRVHAINGAMYGSPNGDPSIPPGDGASSDTSNVASATTLPLPPAAPSDLQAIPIAFNEIDLVWTDHASNETGYVLEQSLDGVTWTPIANLAANATSYQDFGVTGATMYQYRVHAVNGVV